MAEIQIVSPDCEDEGGKRGKRGGGLIQVNIWDDTNTPADEPFYLHVALLGV